MPKLALRAALEYPAGTYYPLLFGGSKDVTLNPTGSARCDSVDVYIPVGAEFYVRTLAVCVGINTLAGLCKNFYNASSAGRLALGVTGVAATATLSVSGGVIFRANLTTSGSGYPPNTTVTCIVTGAGSGAEILADIGANGCVDSLTVRAQGSGYSTPTLAIPGNKTGAAVSFVIPTDLTTQTGGEGQSTFTGYGPSAVFGNPADGLARNTYVAIGDSITQGVYDTTADFNAWPKRVSDTYGVPMINLGDSGISLTVGYAVNSKAWTVFNVASGASHAIIMLGANDLSGGRTGAQLIADLTTVINRVKTLGKVVDLCTVTPHTDTSDVPKANEADRIALNTWIRDTAQGLLGVRNIYDTADAMETSRNSGIWKPGLFSTAANDVANNSRLHPNGAGYDAMTAAFAAIN